MSVHDLIVPTGIRLPLGLAGRVHAIDTTGQAGDIANRLGRGNRPKEPVWIFLPNGQVVIVAGFGQAEAAEIEDAALGAMHRKPFDFKAAREKAGVPSASTFDTRFREGRERRLQEQKRNRVTDPTIKKRDKRLWQGGM